MSAKHVGREAEGEAGEKQGEGEGAVAVEVFAMENSIPPYLFALAVGDLTHQELSPRVKIYAGERGVQSSGTLCFQNVSMEHPSTDFHKEP